jgi:hypothetical protein
MLTDEGSRSDASIKREFSNRAEDRGMLKGERAMRVTAPPTAAKRAPFVLHILMVAALLFCIALINGRPAFFGDTPFYYSQGEALATALGYRPLPMTAQRRADPDSVIPGSTGFDTGHALIIAGARSPIWGLFFFLCERLGHAVGVGLWMLVWAQCWIAAWIIAVLARAMAPRAPVRTYWSAAVLLALGSSLPFYAAFAMPDVFAGFDLLCLVLLALYRERLSRAEQIGVWSLMAFGVAAHPANGLTLLCAAAGFALLAALGRQPLRPLLKPGGLIACALITAAAATAGAGALYQARTGVRQGAPPFLMAKVLQDGPGRAYLLAHCPGGAAPTLCRFASRPLTSAEDFLWSWAPRVGVAMVVDPRIVVELKREEPAFVLHAVAEHPGLELRAAAAGWAEQMVLFPTIEPLHNPAEFLTFRWWVNTSIWTLLPGHEICARQPGLCQPRLPQPLINALDRLVLMLSLAGLAFAALSPRMKGSVRAIAPDRHAQIRRAGEAAALIALGVLANAAVCGALSGPYPRYEARLIWTAPLMIWLFLCALPWRKSSQP